MHTSTERILATLIERQPPLSPCRDTIHAAARMMIDCYIQGHRLFTCGNGGSASDAEHIVGELMKSFLLPRPLTDEQKRMLAHSLGEESPRFEASLQQALPAISLVSHVPLSTAFANDVSPEMVFAQQLFGYARSGDLLIAISTSGRSKNVLNAVKVARAFGIGSIALTGETGAPLVDISTVAVRVPARETTVIQEYHLMVYHCLCAMVENEFFHP